MKGKYTQEQVDDFTYELLKQVIDSPNLKTKIESIRTGGQTGFDEAGTKAGIKLGLPTLTLAPKGWTFRNVNGRDISNESLFKARFNQESKPVVQPKLVTDTVAPTPKKVGIERIFKIDGKDVTDSHTLLNNLLDSENVANVALVEYLQDKLPNIEVKYGATSNVGIASYNSKGVLTFDLDKFKKHAAREDFDSFIETKVLHELFHSVSSNLLDDPNFQKTEEYKYLNRVFEEYKDSFTEEEKKNLEIFNEWYNNPDKKKSELPKHIVNEYNKYYAAYNIKEFLAETMTSDVVRKRLASVTKDKSIVNKIIQIIKDALGITEGSLLDEAIDAITKVIEYKKDNGTYLFFEHSTSYSFNVVNDEVISGQYKKGDEEWKDMNPKNIEKKYLDLRNKALDMQLENKVAGIRVNKETIFESRNQSLVYTSLQKKALNEIADLIDNNKEGCYLLAGYAGTGKTTLVENILKYATQRGKETKVTAPTGKAINVLRGKLADKNVFTSLGTIHSTIYGEPDENGDWTLNKSLENSIIVVDESSMIEDSVMKDLLRATKQGNNLVIFLGDGFQLEQVGEKTDLFEVLNTPSKFENQYGVKILGSTQLTEVKRQGEGSKILEVATLMRSTNRNIVPSETVGDFKIVNSIGTFTQEFKDSIASGEDSIMIVSTNKEKISMNLEARKAKFGSERKVVEDDEVLVSLSNSADYANSETFVVDKVEEILPKERITLSFKEKGQFEEREYDVYPVFVRTNDGHSKLVLNFPTIDKPSVYHGQILQALSSSPGLRDLLDPYILHTKKGAKLSPAVTISTYGYALTAHKSQGSQWKKVFVNQSYVAPSWNGARWFYTAITRASDEVVVHPTHNNIKISPEVIEQKFNEIAVPNETVTDNSIEPSTFDLGMSVQDFMFTKLTKEQREIFREMKREGIFKTKC